jgi:hypothetical protein
MTSAHMGFGLNDIACRPSLSPPRLNSLTAFQIEWQQQT